MEGLACSGRDWRRAAATHPHPHPYPHHRCRCRCRCHPGFRGLSLSDWRHAAWGVASATAFLHFLDSDPGFQVSVVGRPAWWNVPCLEWVVVVGGGGAAPGRLGPPLSPPPSPHPTFLSSFTRLQGWEDVYFFCGRQHQFCGPAFTWNARWGRGWGGAGGGGAGGGGRGACDGGSGESSGNLGWPPRSGCFSSAPKAAGGCWILAHVESASQRGQGTR